MVPAQPFLNGIFSDNGDLTTFQLVQAPNVADIAAGEDRHRDRQVRFGEIDVFSPLRRGDDAGKHIDVPFLDSIDQFGPTLLRLTLKPNSQHLFQESQIVHRHTPGPALGIAKLHR